ncbi:MAG: PEP-CTERM sorting domain-containing protein [Myxococcota bacterium]|jgi:hypothetical protein
MTIGRRKEAEDYVLHRIALTAAALTVILTAPGARAGTITIDFDLSNSVVSILGGVIVIPPGGSITSAAATVTIQGSSISDPVAGEAALSNLNLQASVNQTIAGIANLTGSFSGSQVGAANGSLSAGLGKLVINTVTMNLSALINCAPAGPCGILGSFPISVMSTSPITGVGSLGVGGFGTFGNGTLNAILSVTIAGNPARINLVGQEVSRTFMPTVPEPSTFGMFGLGMLGLAGLSGRRSRN